MTNAGAVNQRGPTAGVDQPRRQGRPRRPGRLQLCPNLLLASQLRAGWFFGRDDLLSLRHSLGDFAAGRCFLITRNTEIAFDHIIQALTRRLFIDLANDRRNCSI